MVAAGNEPDRRSRHEAAEANSERQCLKEYHGLTFREIADCKAALAP
jgi:hypothetical protein